MLKIWICCLPPGQHWHELHYCWTGALVAGFGCFVTFMAADSSWRDRLFSKLGNMVDMGISWPSLVALRTGVDRPGWAAERFSQSLHAGFPASNTSQAGYDCWLLVCYSGGFEPVMSACPVNRLKRGRTKSIEPHPLTTVGEGAGNASPWQPPYVPIPKS